VGKAFLYRASDRSAAAMRGVLRRLVRRVFGGDRLSVVSTLYAEPTSEKEIEELRRLVEELGKGGRRGDA